MASKFLLALSLLLVAVGTAQSNEGAASLSIVTTKPEPGPKPAPSCSTGVDSKSCKDLAGCVWCEATFGPGKKPKGSCYDEASAAWLPAIFKCSKPAINQPADTTTAAVTVDSTATTNPTANPATSQHSNAIAAASGVAPLLEPPSPVCADEVDKSACNHKAGCVWCEKGIMGMCFSQERAQWLPPQIFSCPHTYTLNVNADEPAAAPGSKDSCKDAVDKASCKDTTGCVWCEGSFGAGKPPKAACYSEVKAQFLPAQFFKCTAPSAALATAAAAAADEAQAAPGSELSCKGAVDADSCTDTTGCVWCEGNFGAGKKGKSACYSQTKAQFLPAQFFKCSAPTAAQEPDLAAASVDTAGAAAGGTPNLFCRAALNEVSCKVKAGCVWCEANFNPKKPIEGRCYSEFKAQWLPSVFKCAPTATVAAS